MIFILSLQDLLGENNLVKTLLRIGVSLKNMPGEKLGFYQLLANNEKIEFES